MPVSNAIPLLEGGRESIVSNGTLTLDSIPLGDFISLKYFITSWNNSATVAKKFEMEIIKEDGQLKSTVFNKTGKLKLSVNPLMGGGNMNLQLINQEGFEIEVEFAKLVLGTP